MAIDFGGACGGSLLAMCAADEAVAHNFAIGGTIASCGGLLAAK